MVLSELRKNPHLSISGILEYVECGLLYRLGRIDKLPMEFKSDALEFGTVIHHPEISFRALNHGAFIITAKRNSKGESIRRSLVENHFGAGAFDEIRKNHYMKDVYQPRYQ